MADKSFGVKELNLLNASGTPTVTSPNNLNLNANTVAISTSCTIGNNLTVTSTTNSANLNVTGIGTLTRGFATDLSVSGISTISQPSNANPHSLWDVVNNGASAYRFTGPGQDGAEDNPNIYLVRGQRYIFKVNASGHPFQLRVANGGAAYSDGVTNNGAQTGNVVINVQHDAPAQLFYQCTSHGSMVGNIYVVGGPQVISGVVTATSFVGDGSNLTGISAGAISSIGSDGAGRVLTSDGDGTATAHSFVTVASNRLSVNRGSGTGANPLIVRRTDASGIIAEFANSSGYGLLIGQNSATGEAYLRTGTGQPLVITTNAGSGIANERLRIASDGKVSIASAAYSGGGATPELYVSGTSGRTVKIHGGSATSSLQLTTSSTGEGEDVGLQIFESGSTGGINNKNGDMIFSATNVEVMRILSGNDGNAFTRLLIGTSVETFAMVCLKVAANIRQPMSINDSSNTSTFTSRIGFRTGNNQVGTIKSSNSGTQYNTSSDYRLKENASAISDGITRIKTLKPYKFNWISDETNTPVDGFFAHEVSSVVPEAISGTKDKVADAADVSRGDAIKVGDPVYQGIDQSKLVPLLTAALQEAIVEIETLKTKVAALEGS